MDTTLASVAKPRFEVLVVDADRTTNSALRDALGGSARVRDVSNGYEALYELGARHIDVIVLELFLPGAGESSCSGACTPMASASLL